MEAKNLMKKDISVLGKGKSDPYAIVTVGAQQFRTQTIDNNVNPKWDYWCEVKTFRFFLFHVMSVFRLTVFFFKFLFDFLLIYFLFSLLIKLI